MPQISINSILGGASPMTNFASSDQFRASLGIDPGLPFLDSYTNPITLGASGLLRPSSSTKISGSVLTDIPMWMKTNPKETNMYVYGLAGSVYTVLNDITVTALSDAGEMSSSSGNGCEYYDNYMYFAKNTDIARYGPLDGTPKFNGSYWTGTLGKTALVNTTTNYPKDNNQIQYPNHVMHRHSDGKLYIADIVGNQGTIHYIATKKTTVEGDTDDGSTYSKLTVGYGLWPTAMESYGSDLVIAFYEGTGTLVNNGRTGIAKIAFWDTTSTNFNKIVWVEFPDQIITAIKNINGVLYFISGDSFSSTGFRVTEFVGSSSFKEVAYIESGQAPFPGAVDGQANQLIFGSYTQVPTTAPCVYSLGLQKARLSSGLFNIQRGTSSTHYVYALNFKQNRNFSFHTLLTGTGISGAGNIESQSSDTSTANSIWWSQLYKIGQPFQIKRIRIPLAATLAANMTIVPTLYFDNGTQSQVLTTINSTNFPSTDPGKGIIANIRTAGDGTNIIMGQHNFWLELKWTGSAAITVALPIVIEFETIPD